MPVREPPPRKPATKFKTKLLIKVSEQARWSTWLGSQKKCGISWSVQKDTPNNIRVCNKEFKALVIQDSSTSNSQSWGFMITV
jgi:cell division inhibitor SulA